jgi:hypothetical protein
MNSSVTCQPIIRVNSDPTRGGPGSVSACCLGPELAGLLANSAQRNDLLKSIFRVAVAQEPSPETDGLPGVSGRYLVFDDEVRFIPHFPFERDVRYRASFNPRRLGTPESEEVLVLEFAIPSEREARALTTVTHIFPSCGLLPENLLRFYVCFSNSMQRGRMSKEVSLLDADGRPVADALYRPPVELWDRTMRYLTVLLDPGRLKRWVGPNIELGPPLKAGHKYTLQIGSGMTDLYGRSLGTTPRKDFLVGSPIREHISVDDWKVLPPATGSRQALEVTFPNSLDWVLLLRTIAIRSAGGSFIHGQIVVDQCERRWSFIPSSPWVAGAYQIVVESGLEDVCGNSIAGAFDRPLRKGHNLMTERNDSSLIFQLT